MPKIGRLNAAKTIFLLCDMQEKFSKAVIHFNEIVETSIRVAEASKLLHIPCLITEHYPKGWYFLTPMFYCKKLHVI